MGFWKQCSGWSIGRFRTEGKLLEETLASFFGALLPVLNAEGRFKTGFASVQMYQEKNGQILKDSMTGECL